MRPTRSTSPSTCWRCCRRRGGWCAPASRPITPRSSRSASNSKRPAEDPRFRFFGNVVVGEHVEAAELAERYDAVIYAVGAQSDRALNIPGEELPGSVAAVDFVGWYNAHPQLRGDVARSVGRPRGRHRQRQRRTRRRAHPDHRPRRAGGHRYRRSRTGIAAPPRRGGSGDHRPARAAADRVHHAGVARAGRPRRSRRDRRSRADWRASPTRMPPRWARSASRTSRRCATTRAANPVRDTVAWCSGS